MESLHSQTSTTRHDVSQPDLRAAEARYHTPLTLILKNSDTRLAESQMAHLKGEDKFFAEPNVQHLTSKQRRAKQSKSASKSAVDDGADEAFSGDLLGCFAVFDGHVNASASSHAER